MFTCPSLDWTHSRVSPLHRRLKLSRKRGNSTSSCSALTFSRYSALPVNFVHVQPQQQINGYHFLSADKGQGTRWALGRFYFFNHHKNLGRRDNHFLICRGLERWCDLSKVMMLAGGGQDPSSFEGRVRRRRSSVEQRERSRAPKTPIPVPSAPANHSISLQKEAHLFCPTTSEDFCEVQRRSHTWKLLKAVKHLANTTGH